MAICPSCDKAVDYLNNYQRGEAQYSAALSPGVTGLIYAWEDAFIADEPGDDFECPFCTEIIATGASAAETFLRGEQ